MLDRCLAGSVFKPNAFVQMNLRTVLGHALGVWSRSCQVSLPAPSPVRAMSVRPSPPTCLSRSPPRSGSLSANRLVKASNRTIVAFCCMTCCSNSAIFCGLLFEGIDLCGLQCDLRLVLAQLKVQSFGGGKRHPLAIRGIDCSIAITDPERGPKVLCCRSEIARRLLRAFHLIVEYRHVTKMLE